MLLAVEGGGFFSTSASGYSNGLTVLLLGKKTDEKPMRVTPWKQYQLVDQEPDPDLRLASNKNRRACGCASLLCFGRAAAGLDSPSPLKVGPTRDLQDGIQSSPDSEKVKDSDVVDGDHINSSNAGEVEGEGKGQGEPVHRNDSGGRDQTGRRVQWTDAAGGELFVVREFEPSEHSSSDDEFENGNEGTCSCRLM